MPMEAVVEVEVEVGVVSGKDIGAILLGRAGRDLDRIGHSRLQDATIVSA